LQKRVKFVTDSTCDLPRTLLRDHDITVLSLHVFLGERDCLDGVDLQPDELFRYAQASQRLPHTAAASVLEFYEAFKKAFDDGYDAVLYTGISAALSSTLQNAMMAARELAALGIDPARVHCVDSMQLSSGSGELLLRGLKLAEEGWGAAEIARELEGVAPRIRTSFVVDTLEYLHMGGRCGSVAYLAGSMLKIHPMIEVNGGKMRVGDRFHGDIAHCLEIYRRKTIEARLESLEPGRVFIVHTFGEAAPEIKRAEEALKSLNYFGEVRVAHAGATISSHCGPGTLGYITVMKA
jgi:DegV family protein with EDD domain